MAAEAGVPAGVLNVVHGGESVVNGICDHPDIKAVSFVGSTRVGGDKFDEAITNYIRRNYGMGKLMHRLRVYQELRF